MLIRSADISSRSDQLTKKNILFLKKILEKKTFFLWSDQLIKTFQFFSFKKILDFFNNLINWSEQLYRWSKCIDRANIQLMELNVSWWSSKSADGANNQLMELKVSWWRSKSSDGALIQMMEIMLSSGAQVQQLI